MPRNVFVSCHPLSERCALNLHFSEIVFDFRNRDPSLSSFLRMAGVQNAASGRDGGETAVKNSGIRTWNTSWRP